MQFVSFIASMMLIVLINQQSITGLPIDEESMEKRCSEELRMVKGECMPMDHIQTFDKRYTPQQPEKKIAAEEEPLVKDEPAVFAEERVPKKTGSCAEGWEHGEHGICQKIKSPKSTKSTAQPESDLEEDAEPKPILKEDRKPKPALEEDAEPKPALKEDRKSKPALEEDAEPKPALKEDRKSKPALEEDAEPKPALKEDRKSKPALEEDAEPKPALKEDRKPKPALEEDAEPKPALKEDRKPKPALEEDAEPKPALKEDRKPTPALKEDAESKPVLKEDSKPKENLSRCPEGTKHDEQGSCQEIQPSSTPKASLDLTSLLKKDGSCPDNYKMAEGKCLYIKPKTKTTLYPDGTTADIGVMTRIQPKSGSEGSDMYEKVPILEDNSCPEGTEYSEYGFCQRRIRPSNSKPSMKPDGRCPNDFKLVDGKCTYKTPVTQDRSSTVKTSTLLFTTEATTRTEEPINNRKMVEPLTTSQSVLEMTTPQSVIEITTPQSAIEMTTSQSVKEMTTPKSVIEFTTAKVSSNEFQSQTTSKSL